jgi:phosphoribosylaminoimidazole-succinocarboxamide synthase
MSTTNPVFGPLLAEGKTKQIYAYPDDDCLVYLVGKDQITAGDGARRNEVSGKSRWSTITTANVFRLLNEAKIATHFVKQVSETVLLVRRCDMVPIEHVQRRIATGSYLKRHPEISEGTRFDPVLIETFLKDDAQHDPQILPEDIIRLGLLTPKRHIIQEYMEAEREVEWMAHEGHHVFETLERAWAKLDVTLVDLKIEFGRDSENHLMVADVIDNDSWRLWPAGDKTRMLDKQVYRNLQDVTPEALQDIADRYALVADLTAKLKSGCDA